jgi:uncharacterized protein YbjQ (UPF0145 family)
MRYLTLIVVLLAGCMSNQRVETLSSAQRAAVLNVKVLSTVPKESYESLGTVSGLSCNRNKYQAPNVSNDEAMQGLLIQAAQRGANAVVNTLCQTNSDTDWRNNCWASVKCVGDAIKLVE